MTHPLFSQSKVYSRWPSRLHPPFYPLYLAAILSPGKISSVSDTQTLPNAQRLSVLLAAILLAYAIAHQVALPGRSVALEVAGVFLSLEINARSIVAVALAGMAATGTDWLLRDHPTLRGRSTLPHWLLPGLTAWGLSIPLNLLAADLWWWAAVVFAGIFLVLVFTAEYIVVDPESLLYPLAAGGLIALSYVLFLTLGVSLHAIGLRLLLTLPPLALAAWLVSLKTVHLRLNRWLIPQTLAITLIVTQFAAALHYLPLSPIAVGLGLLGAVYALSNLVINLDQGHTLRQAIVEPLFILLVIFLLALWLG